jgi:hypothetical protein
MKSYQLATMSKNFPISHSLSGKIIQKTPISLPLFGKTATISPISFNWRKKQIKTMFCRLAFTVQAKKQPNWLTFAHCEVLQDQKL